MADDQRWHQRAWNSTKQFHENHIQPKADWVRRQGQEASPGTTGVFFFLAILLYVFDLVFDYGGSTFIISFSEVLERALSILRHGAFLFFVALSLIFGRAGRSDPAARGTRIAIIFVVFWMTYFGTPYSMLHLWFGLAFWWFLLRPSYESESRADILFIFLLIIDIYGTFIANKFITPASVGATTYIFFGFLTVLPIWGLYMVFSTQLPKASGMWIFKIAVLLLLLFNHLPNIRGVISEDIRDVGRLDKFTTMVTDSYNGIKTFVSDLRWSFRASMERQLESATGGYYQGKVEENVREQLGVYLENIKAAETEFYQNDEVIVWGSIKARTLDEEKPINVVLSCWADRDETKQGRGGDIEPETSRNFVIETFEERDFSCKFDKESLSKGAHTIKFLAHFNFPTMAYLKTYFMDYGTRMAMVRDGIDIFEEYGITDIDPIAVYTNGPVKIGAETTKSLPIGAQEDRTVRLGVTIENQWQGRIKKIRELIIEIPDSMKMGRCDIDYRDLGSEDGFNRYRFDLNIRRFRDIKEFKSFNCALMITDVVKLLGTTPISTRYYRINVDYDYELESDISVNIKEERGKLSGLLTCYEVCNDRDGCTCLSGCTDSHVLYDQNCEMDDKEAPGKVTDLEANSYGKMVTLKWTAAGDDGNKGYASRYELRYSNKAITTEDDWGKAKVVDLDVGEIPPGGSDMRGMVKIPEIRETEGSYVLKDVPEGGTSSILVIAEGYKHGDTAFDVKKGITSEKDIQLEKFEPAEGVGTLKGKVLDNDKNPIKKAIIAAGGVVTFSGDDGSYVLDNVPINAKNILVFAGGGGFNAKAFNFAGEGKTIEIDFDLGEADTSLNEGNIVGEVTNKKGEQIQGAYVWYNGKVTQTQSDYGEKIYFAIKAMDGKRWGAISNNAVATIQKIERGNIVCWPVDDALSKITSPYGKRDLDRDGVKEDNHDGIDFGVPEGTPVKAVADGVVIEVCEGYCDGYGNNIIIMHKDDLYTRYNHLKSVDVKENQEVKGCSEQIAESGDTGYSTGAHLDFKIYDSTDFREDKGVYPKPYYADYPYT